MLMVPQKAGFWGRLSPGRPWLVHAYKQVLNYNRTSCSIWLRSGLHAKDPQPCVARGCSTQEKVPDTQPCYSGSERTGRPDRVLDVLRAAPTTSTLQGVNCPGCGLEPPPIFFQSMNFLVGQLFNNRLLPRCRLQSLLPIRTGHPHVWLESSSVSSLILPIVSCW